MSLLITHDPHTDPAPFLALLTAHDGTWHIDNKYYTARVNVRVQSVGEAVVDEVLAVVYLYTNDPTPPPGLEELLRTTKPELSFAVRLSPDAAGDHDAQEDAWDARGIEYVHLPLSSTPDDDDAPPALVGVVDSLQTIMWPGLVRKPTGPVRRDTGTAAVGERVEGTVDEAWRGEEAALDAWLDDDDEAFPDLTDPPVRRSGFDDDFLPPNKSDTLSSFVDDDAPPDDREEEYTPFQSAPPAFLPTDPTALLTHLRTLRTHLSTIPDADERRVRAGREVVALFAGLGVGLEADELDG